jgi:AcrR family transcriptional regulator
MSVSRRDELLHRLEDLFLSEGFSRLTIDDIAAGSSARKSTLYAVATSKDDLVVATMKLFFGKRLLTLRSGWPPRTIRA